MLEKDSCPLLAEAVENNKRKRGKKEKKMGRP